MRMSESIFLPNGVAIISSFNLVFLSPHTCHSPLLANEMEEEKKLRSGRFFFFTQTDTRAMNVHTWIRTPTCSLQPHCQSIYIQYTVIPHSVSPPPRVIYLSVCGRIDSPLYSRPLKPGGDSPCQAAGSNEKPKEHINSSI